MTALPERVAQAITSLGGVPSPCISVCSMRVGDEMCQGCWRTLDEIAHWAQMDDADKRRVWMQLAHRAERTHP